MRGVPARRTTVHIDGWLRVGCRHAIAIDITTVDGVIFVFSLLRNTLMKENHGIPPFHFSGARVFPGPLRSNVGRPVLANRSMSRIHRRLS
jgi:hypothetical protein